MADGLSQNSVQCIFQDSEGVLWLGTQDGLNSFDGRNFRVFRHDQRDSYSLSNQFILAIQEDRQGFLWVGTRNGLNRLNRRTGKVNRVYLDSVEKYRINAVYNCLQTDNKGNVYIRHWMKPTMARELLGHGYYKDTLLRIRGGIIAV